MLGVLIFAVAAGGSTPEPANGPLSTALFKLCPALMSKTLKADDPAALSALGYKVSTNAQGRAVITPIDGSAIEIDAGMSANGICPVTQIGAPGPSVEKLSQVLAEAGLKVDKLASPIGGGLINSKDAAGKPVTSTQVMENSLVTLVMGH